MDSYIVAGIGEILWDVMGNAEELGGAPVNFVYHANALGATGHAISTIGDDLRGTAALIELEKRNLSQKHITVIEDGTTGYVKADLDNAGVATYHFPENVAWDNIIVQKPTRSIAKSVDAVCFGSLAQRSHTSRTAIHSFLQATRPDTLKVFDINIRQQFYTKEILIASLKVADVLKLNDDEIVLMTDIHDFRGSDKALLEHLVYTYNLKLVAFTRGTGGSLLMTPTSSSDHPGFPTKVVDTIGAGDSFTAATVLGLLRDLPLELINERANRLASYVCTQKGAMPTLPKDLLTG